MKKIGFIGVGIMGKSMVRNLMKNDFEVSIFARNKEKVLDVISEGANFYPTIKECVSRCDAVITIVGFPKDVEEVYFGENGILENVKEGTYVIDMTTSSPKLAVEIFKKAKEKGIKALDAPVTGGDIGAKNGTLTILVGGEEEDYKACLPILKAMGTNIHYEGKAGFGQHTKLANQIMIAGAISGVCEAMAYAKDKGLDVKKMLDSVSTGVAGSKQLELVSPKILEEDFAPGFFIKHFIKDMKLAKEEALADNVNLDILSKVLENYEELEREGFGDLGTQALIKHYNK
ncbi:NAD(P)-dependent oxidoreductase [Clostridium perfringens]|nr:NAD(P)-dependent oxidoreductase [Clostridium perfringens]